MGLRAARKDVARRDARRSAAALRTRSPVTITTSMSELSPAAQAVLDAWESKLEPMVTCLTHDPEREALAAALRAAADQVVPSNALYARSCCEFVGEQCRAQLLAIAEELDSV
jgi:hypothetical protein